MRKQKAKINFMHVRDNDLTEISQLIHDKMSGNPDFPTPKPSLADFQIAIDNYSAALIKCKDGTKHDTADKNVKRKILEKFLTELGNYVNIVADGDLVMLDGSGFPVTKAPEHIGILPAPAFLKVREHQNSGSVKIEIGKVERALEYLVLFYEKDSGSVPANDSEWQSKIFSKTKGIISELASGKKYIFKAAATSSESNKRSIYSFTNPIEKIIT